MVTVRTTWHGEELQKRMRAAEQGALEETAQLATARARAVHPGWQSRTGQAEASIQPIRLTRQLTHAAAFIAFLPIPLTGNAHRARSRKTGRLRKPKKWDMHGIFLEIGFLGRPGARALDAAARQHMPGLAARISRRLQAG